MEEQKEKLNEVKEKEISGGKTVEVSTLVKVPFCSVCNCVSTPNNPITHYEYQSCATHHLRDKDRREVNIVYKDKKYICDKCYEESKNKG